MTETKRDRREYARANYLANRAKRLEQSRVNYQKNRAKRLEQAAAWVKNNPLKRKAIEERNRKKNRAKQREACRAWYRNNRDAYLEKRSTQKTEQRKDPAYLNRERARNRAWIKNHPDVVRRNSQKRRALKRAATINLEGIKAWFRKVRHAKAVVCYYCGDQVPGKDCHFDHIVPLAKGGAHSVENLCVSCAPCNLSKKDRTPQAWIKVGQQFLAL